MWMRTDDDNAEDGDLPNDTELMLAGSCCCSRVDSSASLNSHEMTKTTRDIKRRSAVKRTCVIVSDIPTIQYSPQWS